RDTFGGGIAVITGAGAGIGAGLARRAARLGMTVVLADIDAKAVAALRDELTAAGAVAVDVGCDVRDPEAVCVLAERTYRAGGVDGGDVAAAESQRCAMLDIKAEAMDPLAAAEAVFDQAAEGRFYLLTQPDYVGSAMAERAEVLVAQRPPMLRGRRFDPARR